MGLNRRRGLLVIASLIVWSVLGCLVVTRWRKVTRYFSIEKNSSTTVVLSVSTWNRTSHTSGQPTVTSQTNGGLQNFKNSQGDLFPGPADDLALRVNDFFLGQSLSSSLNETVRDDDFGMSERTNTSGLNRKQSWNFFHRLAVDGKLDFRGVAKYSLDGYLSKQDQEILAEDLPKDLTTIASPGTSLVELLGLRPGTTVKVGENVTVRVTLRDTKGRHVLTGGHQVRVWMVGKGGTRKSAAVDVNELRNGTYVASLPVLWPGPIEFQASLQRPREFQRAVLSVLNNMKMMLQILACFSSGSTEEVTLCSVTPVVPGYGEVCNLTSLNSGLPWYCGRPSTPGLQCRDWAFTSIVSYPKRYEGTDTENALILPFIDGSTCGTRNLHPAILLTAVRDTKKRKPPKICRPLTPRKTWEIQSPRGYWEDTYWRPLIGCPLPRLNKSVIFECFHDTHFIAMGDSNARKLVEGMKSFAGCPRKDKNRSAGKHVYIEFHCPEQKLRLSWIPHAFPFCTSLKAWSPRKFKRSPGRALDSIPPTGKYVVVIHLYMHLTIDHIYVYTLHVRDAARGVRDVLKRNPTVKVFVQGPHAVDNANVAFQSDFFASRALHILQREFRELTDHVIFLNMMDMTVANENCDVHPNKHVVRTVGELVVSYVCPK